jgi:hypothetical protein
MGILGILKNMGIFAFLGIIAAVFMGGLFGSGGSRQGRAIEPPIVKQASCKATVEEGSVVKIDIDADKEYFADGATPLYKDKEGEDWVLVKRNAVIPSWKIEGGAASCRFPSDPGREIPSSVPRREWSRFCRENGGIIVRETEKIGKVVGSGKDVYIGLGHCSGDPGATCVDPLVQDGIFVLEEAGKKWGEFGEKCKGGWKKIISSQCSKLDGYWWDFSFYLKRSAFEDPGKPTYEGLPCWTKMSCAGDIIVDGGRRRREMMDEYRKSGVCPVDSSNVGVNAAGIYESRAASFNLANEAVKITAVTPTDTVIKPKGKSLQLGTFYPKIKRDFAYEWWTPACKPAIYLYPEESTKLKVQVDVDGELTKSIPEYPEGGWEVLARPDGRIEEEPAIDSYRHAASTFLGSRPAGPIAQKTVPMPPSVSADRNLKREIVDSKYVPATGSYGSNSQEKLAHVNYPYLFYEAKIKKLRVPKKGWVVAREDLGGFFKKILGRLGLNNREIGDFSEYWVKKLNDAPYYFIGLLDRDELDSLEKISFSKEPDTFIRVRFVFEKLFATVRLEPPNLPEKPKRGGFVAVDWGGVLIDGSCEEGLVH